MVSRAFVLGYHGCDLALARRVVAGDEQLRPSRNPYDWLGHGYYFWEDSPTRGLLWAREEAARNSGKVQQPAVLGAIIDLGNCLNLIDTEHLGLVVDAHRNYLGICAKTGIPPMRNSGPGLRARYLDQAVFETLHQFRHEEGRAAFDTIRAFFAEGAPLYENAGLRTLDHVQLCVRDARCIVGYFLPRQPF